MNSTRETNLHSLWDTGLIQVRLARDFRSNITLYYEYLYQLMLNQTLPTTNDDFRNWIDESIGWVCGQVYLDEQNITMNASSSFHLGDIYYKRNIPVVERRIVQGGQRLGTLLNILAANRPKPSASSTTTSTTTTTTSTMSSSTGVASPTPEKLHWSTITLIAVLAFEFIVAAVVVAYRRYKLQKPAMVVSFHSPWKK